MQKEADTIIDAALAQFAGQRQQVVIVDPDDIVRFNQRQQFIRQGRINALIALPGFTLKINQVKTIVECGP